jgi:hypothetical protein
MSSAFRWWWRRGFRWWWRWMVIDWIQVRLGRYGCWWCMGCGRLERLFHHPYGDHRQCPPF